MVLDKYEVLLKDHLFVTLFLTMLVGAGGNAGNQSAIKIIRGLVCTQSPSRCRDAGEISVANLTICSIMFRMS